MKILKIITNGRAAPTWWHNFTDTLNINGMSKAESVNHIKLVLCSQRIHLKHVGIRYQHVWLEFEEEQDLTFFLLKWS